MRSDVIARRNRIGEMAHRNKILIDGIRFNVLPGVLARVQLATSHAENGTCGGTSAKARYHCQKDGTAAKHRRLRWLFLARSSLVSPALQAPDNEHQIAVSHPLRKSAHR
jgi:hypothetical protein